MFLRCTRCMKDGKAHEYWNLVENRRLADGRVAQRQVLCLGEINASQREAWRKTVALHGTAVALHAARARPQDIAARYEAHLARVGRRSETRGLACSVFISREGTGGTAQTIGEVRPCKFENRACIREPVAVKLRKHSVQRPLAQISD